MIKKNIWRSLTLWLGICAAVEAIALIVGCFVDYDLAQSIYRPDNGFSLLFEAIGKLPGYAAALFACVILYANAQETKTKFARVALCSVYWIGGMLCGALAVLDLFDLVFERQLISFLVSLAAGAAGYQTTLFITLKCGVDSARYKKWAFAALIAVVIVMALTAGFKAVWGRARYEDVLFNGEAFAPWYRIDRTGGSSMPSGHTAMAWAGFLWVAFLSVGGKTFRTQGIAGGAIGVWAALTALSRLLGGRHYLTDVAAGGLIGQVVTMAVCLIFLGAYFQNSRLEENSFWNKL